MIMFFPFFCLIASFCLMFCCSVYVADWSSEKASLSPTVSVKFPVSSICLVLVCQWGTHTELYCISRGLSSPVVGICLQMLLNWSFLLEEYPVFVNNKSVDTQKFSNLSTKLTCKAVFTLNLSCLVFFADFSGFFRLWGQFSMSPPIFPSLRPQVLNYGWNLPDEAQSYISLLSSSHLDPSGFIILCLDHLAVSKPCPTAWEPTLIFIREVFGEQRLWKTKRIARQEKW